MCVRLSELIDGVYGTDAKVARIMGYANPSPLYRVRTKAAFPDVERLERLVNSQPAPGVIVNLNWIVAGKGMPLLRVANGSLSGGMSIGDFVDKYRVTRV